MKIQKRKTLNKPQRLQPTHRINHTHVCVCVWGGGNENIGVAESLFSAIPKWDHTKLSCVARSCFGIDLLWIMDSILAPFVQPLGGKWAPSGAPKSAK